MIAQDDSFSSYRNQPVKDNIDDTFLAQEHQAVTFPVLAYDPDIQMLLEPPCGHSRILKVAKFWILAGRMA